MGTRSVKLKPPALLLTQSMILYKPLQLAGFYSFHIENEDNYLPSGQLIKLSATVFGHVIKFRSNVWSFQDLNVPQIQVSVLFICSAMQRKERKGNQHLLSSKDAARTMPRTWPVHFQLAFPPAQIYEHIFLRSFCRQGSGNLRDYVLIVNHFQRQNSSFRTTAKLVCVCTCHRHRSHWTESEGMESRNAEAILLF